MFILFFFLRTPVSLPAFPRRSSGARFEEAAEVVEVVETALFGDLGYWHQRKCKRSKQIVATKALASKICKACYFIMKDQVDFDVKLIFG